MPTYEFQCRRCRTEFELITSVAEYERMKREKEVKCTSCQSDDVVPEIVAFQVQTSRKSA